MTNPRLQRQVALARRYASQGRPDAARRICQNILEAEPDDPVALTFLASEAMAGGMADDGISLLRRACVAAPDDPGPRRELARAYRNAGHSDRSVESWIDALAMDGAGAHDWAEAACAFRDAGDGERAARCFTREFLLDSGLANARRDHRLAPLAVRELSQAGDDLLRSWHYQCNVAHARVVEEEAQAKLPERWDLFLERFHQRIPTRYADERQQPDFHYHEGLRARPFWPRDTFPWLEDVEAATDMIREEFPAAVNQKANFEPYVRNAEANAPEGWRAMSGQLAWSSLHLPRGNKIVAENQALCPHTTALMERLPLARADGHAPEVFFSVLRPGTHIPPHYGVSNTKLAIHLPLVIPRDCAITVGGETHGWTPGECLVFDDSFLHEAWNRSDEQRVVLIFEAWNPDLSTLERKCLCAVIERGESWYRDSMAFTAADLAS